MGLRERARQAAAQEALEAQQKREAAAAATEAAEMGDFQEVTRRRRQQFMDALNDWTRDIGVMPEMLNVSVTKTYDRFGKIDANVKATFECEGIRFYAQAVDRHYAIEGDNHYTAPKFLARLDRMGISGYFGGMEAQAWGEIKTLSDLHKALRAREVIIGRMKGMSFWDSSSQKKEKRRVQRQGKDRNPEGGWH
jgi:hypothetical protein